MNFIEFLTQNGIALASLIAIIAGPVLAVKVTRIQDKENAAESRKYQILSDLMRTRQARIDPIHVSALNLIQLEFYGQKDVLSAFKNYAAHLNSHFPEEDVAFERHVTHGDDLFADLLHSISLNLGYSFDKRDLERLGYLPTGLGNLHENSRANAFLLREILEGKRALNVSNFVSDRGIFPPVPKPKQIEKKPEAGEN
ncbi:DUF6680 family protein [Loktanella salsilacus]|uniref:DUF6680 family protein n=1 Tax=Loktanella salsilacus TaxID=195913 RepID=UPI003704C0B1